jgi:hypothetical protein
MNSTGKSCHRRLPAWTAPLRPSTNPALALSLCQGWARLRRHPAFWNMVILFFLHVIYSIAVMKK